MRQVTRAAVLGFLRDPTGEKFSRVEEFRDEVVTYFTTLPDDQLDEELAAAFDVCVMSTSDDETMERVGTFLHEFCRIEAFAPSPEAVRAALGDEIELTDEDLRNLRVRETPPPIPVSRFN